MKKVEIYDEENSIIVDDSFATTDFTFYPESKKFEMRSSIKDDCFYTKQIIEYKISVNPIELQMRTLESSHEPPLEYSIKDGVVLESELKKNDILFPDRISDLKKEVEWSKISLLGNYEVNLYILSKHPEIITKEDYRRFIRQSVEKIRVGIIKIEEAVKNNSNGLQIYKSENGNTIWFNSSIKLDDEAGRAYLEMSELEQQNSEYGKKVRSVEEFEKDLFTEKSSRYVGISKYEFRYSDELLVYLENLLSIKPVPPPKAGHIVTQNNNVITKVAYLLTAFFVLLKLFDMVEWNWFAVLAPFLLWEGYGFVVGFVKGFNK